MLGAAAGPREPERGGAGPGGGGAEPERDRDQDRERGPASAAAPPPPPVAARHGAGRGAGLWDDAVGDLSRCGPRRAGEPESGSLPCRGSAGWEAAPAARAGRAWQRGKPRGRAREGRAVPAALRLHTGGSWSPCPAPPRSPGAGGTEPSNNGAPLTCAPRAPTSEGLAGAGGLTALLLPTGACRKSSWGATSSDLKEQACIVSNPFLVY